MPVESAAATGDQLDLGGAVRHLIHRSPSWDRYLLDTPSVDEEHFVLTGEMPGTHPLFNDGPGHFHDFQVVSDLVGQIGEFVGQRYFGVPEDRPGLFYRFDLGLTDLGPWRTGGGRSTLTMNIRTRPAKVVGGVPRSLDFTCDLEIGGAPCATGSASLVFLAPILSRNYSAMSRRAMLAAADGQEAEALPSVPVPAAEVSRSDPGNVVVCEPVESTHGRLSCALLTPAGHPVFSATASEHVDGTLLLEALRQTSLLVAGRTHGLNPARSTLGSVQAHFRGYAEPDLPLRCAAVPGSLTTDTHGRPAVPVTLTVTQHGRAVVEATTTVLQDF